MPVNADCQIRCYAVRRLNPFLGLLEVIETPYGRATSSNGLVWDIQLLSDSPADWGSLNCGERTQAWYRYGLWSEREGLVQRPLAAQSHDRQLRLNSERLTEQVRLNLDRLPFPLADGRELWLLDAQQRKPLALLPGAPPPRPEPRHWSACLGRLGVAAQHRFPQLRELESQVKARAGFNIKRVWVRWNADRTAIVESDAGLRLDGDLPVFGIREDWPDPEDRSRVQRYIDWTAPALLTLPYLSDAQRARLESRISGQAVSIEYHWRLYPKVLDSNKLTAARVQASLQASDGGPAQ